MGWVLRLGAFALFGFPLIGCATTQVKTHDESLLHFDETAGDIRQICEQQKAQFSGTLDQIAATGDTPTFPTTFLVLEGAATRLSEATGPIMFMEDVHPRAEIREAATECKLLVEKLLVDAFVREDVYLALKKAQAQKTTLTPEERFLMDETMVDFKRNGLELPAAERAIFVERKKKLVELQAEFQKRLNDDKSLIIVTKAELDGLPDSFISGLKKTEDGNFELTTTYPHYYPFMENAKNGEARKRLEFAFNQRGGERNVQLLEQAIALRNELSTMLGYRNHAHFVLDRRMAKDEKNVLQFLNNLVGRLQEKGKQNLQQMLVLKRKELSDPSIAKIEAWDWRYYENQIRKTEFEVDKEKVREYFPLAHTLQAMFEIYETLLSVDFEEIQAPIWHDSVKAYAVRDQGKLVAYFYIDFFPRDGKYSHAAASNFIQGYLKAEGDYRIPNAGIMANFNPPADGKPSLLDHSEVETLFHEFGHIMHQVLTKARYASYSGTSVKRDFVEAPSQMLENWVWDKTALRKLSGHYLDTSKPLPDDLLNKLIGAKLVNVGIRYLRQAMFALIDMNYHTSASVDSTAVWKELAEKVMLIGIQDGTHPQGNFGHLMGGYDAGYYGYLWSEVYAQDMFTRFEKEGLFNPVTGGAYKKWILEKGGMVDPYVLITKFIGREPNNEAFLRSIGLTPQNRRNIAKTKNRR